MKKLLAILLFFTFISTNLLVQSQVTIFYNGDPEILNKILYVDDNNTEGPWNGSIEYPYQFINDAISNSSNGDTIFVFSGIYIEKIKIDKSIKIFGENKINTIIDGLYVESIIEINSNNVFFKNFTIKNSGGYVENSGIIVNSDNNTFEDCIIFRTKTGILLNHSDHNEIENCTFHTNGEGVFVKTSNNNKICSCCFGHNSIGINSKNSKKSQIEYCYLHSNGIALLMENSSNTKIYHCNISNNCVNLGGVFLVNSENITINDNLINHNGAGIHLFSSKEIIVSNCDFILNTHYAIIFRTPSNNIRIFNCELKNNLRHGIYIEKDNSCKINNNNIVNNNLYGVFSSLVRCNAQKNWWGSPLGPSYIETKSRGRISILLGRIRCIPWLMKPLTGIGTSWDKNEEYMVDNTTDFTDKKIDLPGLDTDNDKVPDWWEEKWGYDSTSWDDHANLDPDQDALNNIEECFTDQWNSSPFYKDIFLEIDWMKVQEPYETNKPSSELLDEIVAIFKNQKINFHCDTGELGEGEEIPFCNDTYSFAKLRDMYWKYFLNNNLTNPREGIFHYSIVCNYCPDLNFPFIGWANLDSSVISGEWIKSIYPSMSKDKLIVGAILHHLGHSLGLVADSHGGIDNSGTLNILSIQWWKYRNYKSCMNYYYKYKFLNFSDGTHGVGDFDDWENINFYFFKNSSFELY